MSSFTCEHCNKEILDSPIGYTTECEHYPLELLMKDALWNGRKFEITQADIDWAWESMAEENDIAPLPAWVAAGRVMDYFTLDEEQEELLREIVERFKDHQEDKKRIENEKGI